MPDFGQAHRLLGFFEMAQGENLVAAEQHLQRAIQLEPENLSYRLSLAQAQLSRNEIEEARRTLGPLRLPYVEAQLRAHAEGILKEIRKHEGKAP
jgi:thioredoxin-like negative regulator of GroEL